jgi:hypothetical protein
MPLTNVKAREKGRGLLPKMGGARAVSRRGRIFPAHGPHAAFFALVTIVMITPALISRLFRPPNPGTHGEANECTLSRQRFPE